MLSKNKIEFFRSPNDCQTFLRTAGFEFSNNIVDAIIDTIAYQTVNEKGKRTSFTVFWWRKKKSFRTI